jgi:hypothetical protein
MNKEETKEFMETWISHCLMGYVADHLPGMDDYLNARWKEDTRGLSYDYWLFDAEMSETLYGMIGKFWCKTFQGKEKEFRKFMKDIDFSGYIEKFKGDFEVLIVFKTDESLDIEVRGFTWDLLEKQYGEKADLH